MSAEDIFSSEYPRTPKGEENTLKSISNYISILNSEIGEVSQSDKNKCSYNLIKKRIALF